MLPLEEEKVASGSLISVKSFWALEIMAFPHARMDHAQCETATQIMVIISFCVVEMRHWSAAHYFTCPALCILQL